MTVPPPESPSGTAFEPGQPPAVPRLFAGAARPAGRAAPARAPGGYAWIVLATAVAVQIVYSVPSQGIGAIAPFLQADLALTREQIGLLVTAAQIGMGLCFLPGGWATDRYGCRLTAVVGLVTVGAGVLLLAQAREVLMAYGATFLAGAAVGIASPAVTMMILRWFAARSRGTAMGIKQSGTPVGGMLAALWLPVASQFLGWRPAVAAMAIAIAAGIALTLLLYRDPPGLLRAERRGTGGWLSPTLFRRPVLVIVVYQAVLVAAQFCVVGYTVLFATEWLHRDAVTAGGVLSLALGGGMVGRIAWGVISDRVFAGGRKPALIAAGGMAATALGGLALVAPSTPLAVVLPLVFAVGFAVLGWQGVAMAMTAELAEPAEVGRVVGFALMALQIGPIVGPPLIGRLLDSTGSYPLAWAALAASCVAATLVFALAMPEGPRPGRATPRAS